MADDLESLVKKLEATHAEIAKLFADGRTFRDGDLSGAARTSWAAWLRRQLDVFVDTGNEIVDVLEREERAN